MTCCNKIWNWANASKERQILSIVIGAIVVYWLYKTMFRGTIDHRIFRTAKAEGMPENIAKILVAQAKYETGNYTSGVFKYNNNLFGYKCTANNVEGLQTGCARNAQDGGQFAKYAKLEDSVKEICRWIKRKQALGQIPRDLSNANAFLYAGYLKELNYFGNIPTAQYSDGINKHLA